MSFHTAVSLVLVIQGRMHFIKVLQKTDWPFSTLFTILYSQPLPPAGHIYGLPELALLSVLVLTEIVLFDTENIKSDIVVC